ncbi:MAG TPA: hypothetical protein VI703_01480 [Anaerolineales bacterium]|nr:hypothetical protein [Anaerolineales bacterium]
MRWRKILAVIIGLLGAGWFAQGTGLFTAIPSFMNNDPTWAVIGVVMAIVALILWPWRSTRSK